MAITLVNVGTVGGSSSGTTVPGLPASWAADDIFVMVVATDNTTSSSLTITGWTKLVDSVDSGGGQLTVAWRRAVGGDSDPTVSGPSCDTVAQIAAFRGCVTTGDPFEVFGTPGTGTGNPVTAPDITTLSIDNMILFMGNCDDLIGGPATFSGYSGTNPTFAEAIDASFGTKISIFMAYGIKTDASATGARTATMSDADDYVAVLGALQPAAAGEEPWGEILQEDGDTLLQEDGDTLLLEGVSPFVDISENGVGTEATAVAAAINITDTGAGAETVTINAVPTEDDSGVGTETTSVITPSYTQTIYFDGTTDVVDATSADAASYIKASQVFIWVGGSEPIPAADSGAGTEAHSVTAIISASDTGIGTETVTTSAAPQAAETGTGAEVHSVTATVGPSENGTGSEATSTLAVVGLSDTGNGTEAHSVTAVVTATDAGAGTETVSVNAFYVAADSGTGTENTATTVAATATETGTGTEAHSVTAVVGNAENGSGSEATSTVAIVGLSDTGSGAETTSITQLTLSTDAGAGSETVSIAAAIPASNTGTGSEAVTVTAVVSATDSGIGAEDTLITTPGIITGDDNGAGTETVQTTGKANASDAGAGTETVSVGIPMSITVTDSGSGTESPSVFVIGTLPGGDIGYHDEGPHIRIPLPPRFIEVSDSGRSRDERTVTAKGKHIFVQDHGHLTEKYSLYPFIFNDRGRGMEMVGVIKTESLESEFNTLAYLAREGVLHADEYAILLTDWIERRLKR